MQAIRNIYIEKGMKPVESENTSQVKSIHHFDKYYLAGSCPFCKNYVVQKTSRKKCKLCNREIIWGDEE